MSGKLKTNSNWMSLRQGAKKDDFNIDINDNVLTISFESKAETESSPKGGWVRNEYVQRSFSRTFTLDDTVDVNNINATYTDGILHLTLGRFKNSFLIQMSFSFY